MSGSPAPMISVFIIGHLRPARLDALRCNHLLYHGGPRVLGANSWGAPVPAVSKVPEGHHLQQQVVVCNTSWCVCKCKAKIHLYVDVFKKSACSHLRPQTFQNLKTYMKLECPPDSVSVEMIYKHGHLAFGGHCW